MAARIAQRDELMSSSRIMHALWRWLLADSPLVRRSAFGRVLPLGARANEVKRGKSKAALRPPGHRSLSDLCPAGLADRPLALRGR